MPALRKGTRVGTATEDFVIEYIPKDASYAYAVAFAPGGGPPLDGIRIVNFRDILRVYA